MIEKYGNRIRKSVQDCSQRSERSWRVLAVSRLLCFLAGNCGNFRRKTQNGWYMLGEALEIRDSQHSKLKQERLEMLAQHFLRVTGQPNSVKPLTRSQKRPCRWYYFVAQASPGGECGKRIQKADGRLVSHSLSTTSDLRTSMILKVFSTPSAIPHGTTMSRGTNTIRGETESVFFMRR